MRQSTEQAALRIGELLDQIVQLATSANDEIKGTLSGFVLHGSAADEGGARNGAIADTIERQSAMILRLVGAVKDLTARQVSQNLTAEQACEKVFEAVEDIQKLMRRSRMLALNSHIEAVKLGERGSTFEALAEEMKSFSEDVASANHLITQSIESFAREMPALREETEEIMVSLASFSSEFDAEMKDVRHDAAQLSNALNSIVAKTEACNKEIVSCSHATLSHLQFQDPVSQGLQRAEYEIQKLLAIAESRDVDDVSLADITDDVGHDGREEQAAGEIVLF